MKRGPKPTPIKLRLITGNRGNKKIQPDPVQLSVLIPEAPEFLTGYAKEEWDRITQILYATGIITKADLSTLVSYCQSWSIFKTASIAMKEAAEADPTTFGLLNVTTNGNIVQNPLVGIANKAANDMVRYAVEFGLTPSARARIGGTVTEKEDPAEKFFA